MSEITCFEQWHELSLQRQWELYQERGKEIERLQAELAACLELLETSVDAWECGMVRVMPQGGQLGYWRDATLNRDWYEAARAAGGGT